MTFPFLYFGHAPADWYEGANLGHVVEVQLTSPPSTLGRENIAWVFEGTFAKGPAEVSPNQPWHWAGPYFVFSFGERWSGAGRAAFSALTDFLLELHRNTPIAEVSLWSAREPGDSRWHFWTIAQRRLPSPRPVYLYDPVNLIFPAKREPELGTYTVDPLFKQARQAARKSRIVSQVVTLEGPLQLVPVNELPRRDVDENDYKQFEKPDPTLRLRKPPLMHGDYVEKNFGRLWVWRYENNMRVSFSYLDDAGHKQSPNHQGHMSNYEFMWELHGPFMHGSGSHSLFRLPNAVLELDFSTGVFTRRFQASPGETIHSIAWLEGDNWGLLSSKGLTLVDFSGEVPQFSNTALVKRTRLRAARGQLLVASTWSEKPILFGAAAGQVKKLASVDINAHFIDGDGESIYVTKDGVPFRLDGWEPMVKEFVMAAHAKAEKARRKAKAKT